MILLQGSKASAAMVLIQRYRDILVPVSDGLTLKHRETHGCVVSIVATDALVLKQQATSIHNAD